MNFPPIKVPLGASHATQPKFHVPTDEDCKRIASLFLGPRRENVDLFTSSFGNLVERHKTSPELFPAEEETTILNIVPRALHEIEAEGKALADRMSQILDAMASPSMPFFSKRYSGQMQFETNLPAILGFVATTVFNPNNVAFEATPFTTNIELEVGKDLCKMLGMDTSTVDPKGSEVTPTAHILRDGTVANLETIWMARNLKHYPLSVFNAIAEGNELHHIAESFFVETCQGERKLLKDCTTWEMLNFKTSTVLEIPSRLRDEYNISEQLMQSINTNVSASQDSTANAPVVFASCIRSTSWDRAIEISGIGKGNFLDVGIDKYTKMDVVALEGMLEKCLASNRPVAQVIATIGTTETGSVDPLAEIIELRKKFEARGLYFSIHADAAMGGYMASMINQDTSKDFMPYVGLPSDTARQLQSLRCADSVTVDPYQFGFVPNRWLVVRCLRDARVRELPGWALSSSAAESLYSDIYGTKIDSIDLDEKRASATAIAIVKNAQQSIALNPSGLGTVLGETMLACRSYAAHWSTMSTDDTNFIVVPLIPLPSQRSSSNVDTIRKEKDFIRQHVLFKSDAQIYKDDDAMQVLHQIGSDLNVNVFACNYRLKDGSVNDDVEKANMFNHRICDGLASVPSHLEPNAVPMQLSSTLLTEKTHGAAVGELKARMGVKGSGDLLVIQNIVTSPFANRNNSVGKMANIFQRVLEEEAQRAQSQSNSSVNSPQSGDTMQGTHPPAADSNLKKAVGDFGKIFF